MQTHSIMCAPQVKYLGGMRGVVSCTDYFVPRVVMTRVVMPRVVMPRLAMVRHIKFSRPSVL